MRLEFLVSAVPRFKLLIQADATAGKEKKRKKLRFQALVAFLVFCGIFATMITPVLCQNGLSDALSEVFSSPMTFLIFCIQFGLGLGLGYFSVKALKYIIAILCILALGVVLNIWQIGGLENLPEWLGIPVEPTEITLFLTRIVQLLGVLTILPMGVGFLLGAIAAATK